MPHYSIDFGGSTIDLARWEENQLVSVISYERNEVSSDSLTAFVDAQRLELSEITSFYVTGGKSHGFESKVHGIPVVQVDEIEAIARGGQWLFREEPNFLVVSMGTGTCMVSVRGAIFEHVGGTGVGGGTFLSLCQLLLKEGDVNRLVEWFSKGDPRKVDLSVGEIVGRGIGRVSADTTASNLGKLMRHPGEIDFTQEDLAAGIANLVGQTIATAAVFAARAEALQTIVLTGKLARIKAVLQTILNAGHFYHCHMVVPERGDFVAAIGAGVVTKNSLQ